MPVEHGYDPAMPGHLVEQPLDRRTRMTESAFTRSLRRRPASIEAIGRRYRKQPDVAAILGHQACRLNRFRRNRSRISNDHLRIGSGLAKPIGAVNDALLE